MSKFSIETGKHNINFIKTYAQVNDFIYQHVY